jgi:hypothetical protein
VHGQARGIELGELEVRRVRFEVFFAALGEVERIVAVSTSAVVSVQQTRSACAVRRKRTKGERCIRYFRKGSAVVERFFFGVFVGCRIGVWIVQVREVFVFVGHCGRRMCTLLSQCVVVGLFGGMDSRKKVWSYGLTLLG